MSMQEELQKWAETLTAFEGKYTTHLRKRAEELEEEATDRPPAAASIGDIVECATGVLSPDHRRLPNLPVVLDLGRCATHDAPCIERERCDRHRPMQQV